jgi:MYXO-CTERM domain-containing protein
MTPLGRSILGILALLVVLLGFAAEAGAATSFLGAADDASAAPWVVLALAMGLVCLVQRRALRRAK